MIDEKSMAYSVLCEIYDEAQDVFDSLGAKVEWEAYDEPDKYGGNPTPVIEAEWIAETKAGVERGARTVFKWHISTQTHQSFKNEIKAYLFDSIDYILATF